MRTLVLPTNPSTLDEIKLAYVKDIQAIYSNYVKAVNNGDYEAAEVIEELLYEEITECKNACGLEYNPYDATDFEEA